MKHHEEEIVRYDSELKIEALRLKGIIQKFPNHFHEHYVIGFIESGQRKLSCKNREYRVEPGDLFNLLFQGLIISEKQNASGKNRMTEQTEKIG